VKGKILENLTTNSYPTSKSRSNLSAVLGTHSETQLKYGEFKHENELKF